MNGGEFAGANDIVILADWAQRGQPKEAGTFGRGGGKVLPRMPCFAKVRRALQNPCAFKERWDF
jgi:hypothetical protein